MPHPPRKRSPERAAAVHVVTARAENRLPKVAVGKRALSEQQKAFIKFWAQGESVYAASAKAGYLDGGATAYKMVRQPHIIEIYQREKKAYEEACQMTRKRVMDGLLEGIEMAKMMAEPASVIAGWREIGKMCGYYEPVQVKHTVTHEGKVILDRLEKLSDDELFRLIQERANAMQQLPGPSQAPEGSAE